jgi:hypothetical protein
LRPTASSSRASAGSKANAKRRRTHDERVKSGIDVPFDPADALLDDAVGRKPRRGEEDES